MLSKEQNDDPGSYRERGATTVEHRTGAANNHQLFFKELISL
jgi:hypothetical protein